MMSLTKPFWFIYDKDKCKRVVDYGSYKKVISQRNSLGNIISYILTIIPKKKRKKVSKGFLLTQKKMTITRG